MQKWMTSLVLQKCMPRTTGADVRYAVHSHRCQWFLVVSTWLPFRIIRGKRRVDWFTSVCSGKDFTSRVRWHALFTNYRLAVTNFQTHEEILQFCWDCIPLFHKYYIYIFFMRCFFFFNITEKSEIMNKLRLMVDVLIFNRVMMCCYLFNLFMVHFRKICLSISITLCYFTLKEI